MNLSARAAGLLDELARDHGVRELAFDKNGLIPMTIGDLSLAISYSPANDCFFFIAVASETPDWEALDPWTIFEMTGEMAARRTRFAVEPQGKALTLLREIPLEGLAYWRLMQTLDEFLADLAAAPGRAAAKTGPAAPPLCALTLHGSGLSVIRI